MRRFEWVAVVAVGLVALAQPSVTSPAHLPLHASYDRLPLSFVPNRGQSDGRVRYQAHAGGASFFFTKSEAVLAFRSGTRSYTGALRFLDVNPNVRIVGERELPGRVNYLIGNNPSRWRTGLPTFGELVYYDLWPGIDVAFRGDRGMLKYEFRLAVGARAEDIRLAYVGAKRLSVVRNGALAALGTHDKRNPVVIDRGLAYSTFVGGANNETASAIAVDQDGSSYLVGSTNSLDFPVTVGSYSWTYFGGASDVFVTKLNAAGSALIYSTFLGGSDSDFGYGLAIDDAGNAYVTGHTDSADFPTKKKSADRKYNGGGDAFVTKLNPAGAKLVYSTYLGGQAYDEGRGIALDAGLNAYVTGATRSGDFPTTAGAFDETYNGVGDAFVTKLSPSGSALAYSTFLGGSHDQQSNGDDGGRTVAADADGNAYVAGHTSSDNFPTTPGSFDQTWNGGSAEGDDAFATKLNATGSALVYSTYLGGFADDSASGLAVDASRAAFLTGTTDSFNFPATAGAFDTSYNGGDGGSGAMGDVFVTKLNPAGSALAYSTFLGGRWTDRGSAITIDRARKAYTTGYTQSDNFPTTRGAYDPSYNGGYYDAFAAELSTTGSALTYSTFLGGASLDYGYGIAVDPPRSLFVAGTTSSTDFPSTPGAFDTSFNGFTDAFATKLVLRSAK